ncbi:MAG TPA: FKBP-type peptidyl-prolyl cis-trans isomerase [Acidimicrobiales bacterium]|nr:FKBP-type peptidyl-prolyl cis-trans isomerase [Acidimicrobiales bacterium]
MSGAKRDRKREGRQARLAALEAARRKAARRRQIVVAVAVAVVAVIVIALISRGGSDKKKVATANTSSTPGATRATVPPTSSAASAAGKPCVAMSDPAPNGAPTVPVKVGPPPTDLVKEDLKVGTGPPVTKDETVTVNYIGVACTTGKVFDSSYSRNQTATFPLSGVIKGWQDGIPGMNVGGQRLLGIPSAMAYGAQGSPPTIGPDEPLWFVVDVVDAKAA